jgi:hypothetical protein
VEENDVAMTAEARALQSAKMKESWIRRKAEKQQVPADPALREAMAKVPMNAPLERGTIVAEVKDEVIPTEALPVYPVSHFVDHITIEVDWEHIPMNEGQQFYAHLKSEFENAGKILNARSMERTSGYTCFMCKKHFAGNPGFTDHSYQDPATGLFPRVDCCGELCVINYNSFRINQRHQRELARAAAERENA